MIFDQKFNNLINTICSYDLDFKEVYDKICSAIPKIYISLTKKLESFKDFNPKFQLNFNHLQNEGNEVYLKFIRQPKECFLMLYLPEKKDLNKQHPFSCFGKVANNLGLNQSVKSGVDVCSLQMRDKQKRLNFYVQLRKEKNTMYMDIIQTQTHLYSTKLKDFACCKLYGELNFEK